MVTKVNAINTSGFVLKINTALINKSCIEKQKLMALTKIPDISGLVKKTDYNAKITEIEDKIRNITG